VTLAFFCSLVDCADPEEPPVRYLNDPGASNISSYGPTGVSVYLMICTIPIPPANFPLAKLDWASSGEYMKAFIEPSSAAPFEDVYVKNV
jgi:hypothetical protein